jgi:hypothetical protein
MQTLSDSFPTVRPAFWKTFAVLYGLGLFGLFAGLPYIFSLIGEFLKHSPEPLPFPVPVLYGLQVVQSAVYLAIAVGIGVWASRKIGNGAPVIEGWLSGEAIAPRLRRLIVPSVFAGVIVGTVLLLLLLFLFTPLVPDLQKVLGSDVSLWKKFLASFYGGIVEEILMRLFLVSLLTWLATKLRSRTSVAFWLASVIVAVIFGLGHLGAASMMMPITAMVVLAALVLNGIASLVFSHLYWKHGLESAIIAHFSADIVIHVIGSALPKG